MVTTPVFEHLFNIGQGLKSFDTSGNHRHSVLSGNPSWVAGRKGKAIALDGTDDAFVAPVPSCDNDDFTVGFWVQNWLDAGATGAGILALQSSDYVHVAENCLVIYRAVGDSKIKVACYDSSHLLAETLDSGVTASSGYMCVRRSGDVVSFFLNGAFVAEATVTDICAFTWLLVGHTSYGYAVADWIDKIRYWDSALSDEEIEYWYAKDKPRWNDSCVLWLRGDEENGVVVKDYSPQANDGTLTASINNGVLSSDIWAVDAEKGVCVEGNGTDTITVDSGFTQALTPNSFSVSFWVNSANPNKNSFIVKPHGSGAYWSIHEQSNNVLDFYVHDGSSSISCTGVLPHNKWVFVTCVFTSASKIEVYFNGVYVNGKSTAITGVGASTRTISLLSTGWWVSNNAPFTGKLKDLRIYNRALSTDEISALYTRTSEVSFGCVGKWLLNEGFGSVAYDSHNRFPLKRGNALNFIADRSYVTTQNVLTTPYAFTFLCWWKRNGVPGSTNPYWHMIIMNINGYSSNWFGVNNGGSPLSCTLADSSSVNHSVSLSISDVDAEHFIGCSWDGQNMYVIVDDVFSSPVAITSLKSGTSKPFLGYYNSLYDWTNGLIDEAMVFNRALSATEIKRVYEADGFLDFIPLQIEKESLVIDGESVGIDWDAWVNQKFQSKHSSLGKKMLYSFRVKESTSDIPFFDSIAFILEEKQANGTPVDLYIKHEKKVVAECTECAIMSMKVNYDGGLGLRYIDVVVKEL